MNVPGRDWLEAWHVNPSLNRDYEVIDGLRGLAILSVVASHLVYVNPASSVPVQFVGSVFAAGAHGVTLFFALSGFLISHSFWKKKFEGAPRLIPSGYGWRRFWKIYPPLALSILILTPLYLLRSHEPAFISNAALWLVGWPLFVPVSGELNPVMWTLIVEVHFYVILPLMFIGLQRLSAKACLWIIFLALLLVPTAFRWWNISRGVALTIHPEINVRFPSMLDGFAFGVLLAGLDQARVITRRWTWLGDLGFVLCLLFPPAYAWLTLHPIASPEWQREIVGWSVKLVAALLLCYVADANHPRVRLLSWPWLRWLGIISYEWYLFHQPIIVWARQSFGPAGGSWIKFGLIVGGSLVVGLALAAVIYRWFSLPILKRGRSRHLPT